MQCSETCEPIAKRRFNCFSMRPSSSWSSCVVNPSTPVYGKELELNKLAYYTLNAFIL